MESVARGRGIVFGERFTDNEGVDPAGSQVALFGAALRNQPDQFVDGLPRNKLQHNEYLTMQRMQMSWRIHRLELSDHQKQCSGSLLARMNRIDSQKGT